MLKGRILLRLFEAGNLGTGRLVAQQAGEKKIILSKNYHCYCYQKVYAPFALLKMKYTFSIPKLSTEFKSGLRKIREWAFFELFQIEHCAFYPNHYTKKKLSKCNLDQKFEFFRPFLVQKCLILGFICFQTIYFEKLKLMTKLQFCHFFLVHKKCR